MFPVFQPESPQAAAMLDVFVWVLLISAGIFAIVTGLIVVALWRGRAFAKLPTQDFGSHRAEMFWMVGPVIIVIWLAAISAKLVITMNAVPKVHQAREAHADEEITLIGHQWWWEVRYNGSGIVGANEIYLPVDTTVRVKLQSADVIHCFWVPQLARKMDVIPGRDNYVWLEASTAGAYQGRCAEFCGNQHAWMNFKVYALSADDYAAWEAHARSVPGMSEEPAAVAGKELFFSNTCVNCHTIAGTAAQATIGPDLTKIGSRKEIGAGILENTPENLRHWMKDPQTVKPGCKMPNFNFSDEQVRQIVAYLESLN